jgi:hypothetical protein
MNNFFRTTIKKLSELSWPEMRDIFGWSANGTIQAENPNLLVARAANADGETLAFVCAESILLVDSYVLNPTITPDEAVKAGAAIESALAQQAGVNRMWIVLPPEAPPIGGEKRIRVVERKVYQAFEAQRSFEVKPLATLYVN